MQSRDRKTNKAETAVLVLLDLATGHLVLTRRAGHLQSHPGEVCFPGGRWEEADESLVATALRELEEELGISAERVMAIKELAVEQTLPGVRILPCMATIASLSPFQMNADEVAAVITLPLSEVLKPENYREILMVKYGHPFKSLEFTASEHFIWGATARIMRQLMGHL